MIIACVICTKKTYGMTYIEYFIMIVLQCPKKYIIL